MRNIKLTIEYDGKRYIGWQSLGDSEKTIQGKIEPMREDKLQISKQIQKWLAMTCWSFSIVICQEIS